MLCVDTLDKEIKLFQPSCFMISAHLVRNRQIGEILAIGVGIEEDLPEIIDDAFLSS
jgi:hypothetical protein